MLRKLPYLLIAALLPAYIAGVLNPGIGHMHDDGLYLVSAKSLAEGNGYRIVSLPGEMQQTKYPVLYPALLAVVWKLFPSFPQNLAAFKFLSLLGAACWMVAVYRLARRTGLTATISAWVCLLCLSSGWVYRAATNTLPDVFFCLFSTIGVLLIMRLTESSEPADWRLALVAGAVCGAAFLTRTVGVALILAAGGSLLWKRKMRELAVFAVCCGVICAPWIIWQARQAAPSDPVLAYYSKANYQGGFALSLHDPAKIGNVLFINGFLLVSGLVSMLDLEPSWQNLWLSLLSAGVIAVALARSLRAGRLVGPAWFAIYSVMLWMWVWPPSRYQIPMLPLVGIWIAGTLASLRHRRALLATAACLIVFCGGLNAADWLGGSWQHGMLEDPNVAAKLSLWIKENAPPDAVVAAYNDPAVYLVSGRKAVWPFAYDSYRVLYSGEQPFGDGLQLRTHLLHSHIRYLMLSPMFYAESMHFRRVLLPLMARCPGAFRLAAREGDLAYAIFEVDSAKLQSCPAG